MKVALNINPLTAKMDGSGNTFRFWSGENGKVYGGFCTFETK